MTFIFPGHSYIAACLDLYIGTESESDKYFLFVYTIDVRRKVIGVVQRSISLPALAFGSGEGMLPFFVIMDIFLHGTKWPPFPWKMMQYPPTHALSILQMHR